MIIKNPGDGSSGIIGDDRMMSGMKVKELVRSAAVWWDEKGRDLTRYYRQRERDGILKEDLLTKEANDAKVVGILSGKLWKDLTVEEKRDVCRAYHDVFFFQELHGKHNLPEVPFGQSRNIRKFTPEELGGTGEDIDRTPDDLRYELGEERVGPTEGYRPVRMAQRDESPRHEGQPEGLGGGREADGDGRRSDRDITGADS